MKKYILYILSVLMLVSSVSALTADEYLVSNWNLDNDLGGIYGATYTVDGIVNASMNFDGINDRVGVSDSVLDNTDISISGCSWIKTTSTGSNMDVIDKYDNSPLTIPFTLRVMTDDTIDFIIFDGTNAPAAESTTDVVDGEWHHVCGVRDKVNDRLYVYVDGVIEGNVTDTTTGSVDNDVEWNIGERAHPSQNAFFDGNIDDVFIVSDVLTSTEIATIYASGSPDGSEIESLDNIVFHLKMGDEDSSGNGFVLNNNGAERASDGFDFDGVSTYMIVDDNDDFSFTDGVSDKPFTISYKVNHDTLTDHQSHLSKWGTVGNREFYVITYANGSMGFSLSDPAGDYIGRTTSASALSTTGWQNITIIYDGSETSAGIDIYVDGLEVDNANLQSGVYNGITNGNANLEIGRRDTLYFDGQISDIIIIGKELNITEIVSIESEGLIYSSRPKLTNLNAWWKLNNTLTDSTPFGNTLTNNGAVYSSGDESFDFDGSTAYMGISSNEYVDITGDSMSLSFWFKADVTSGGSKRMVCMPKSESSGTLKYCVFIGSDTLSGSVNTAYGQITSSTSFSDTSSFHHVVLNYDGINQKLYLDGVEVDSDFNTGVIDAHSDGDFQIGRFGTSFGQYYNGKIKKVGIWHRALSKEEIETLSNIDIDYDFTLPSTAEITSITANGVSFTSGDAINTSDIVFNIITDTIANGSYTIDGIAPELGSNFMTNNNTGSFDTSDDILSIEFPLINGLKIYAPNASFQDKNGAAFCEDNGWEYLITSQTTSLGLNQTLVDWNGTDWVNITGLDFPAVLKFTDCSLGEGAHQIDINLTNAEGSSTISYNILIDESPPTIDIIGNLTQNVYEVNFSTIFNVTDDLSGVGSCSLNITYLSANESDSNFFINCTDTQAFTRAGIYNGFITAIDNVGNTATLSINGTINPTINVNFFDENNVSITNYNATIFHPDGRVIPVFNTNNPVVLSPVNNGILDLGIHNVTFEKLGYVTQTVSVLVNETNAGRDENFTISTSTITITIKDKISGSVVSGPLFNLEFIATVGLVTNTTTGTKTINNTFFRPEMYELRTTSDNYSSESVFFDFTNREILSLTVYVINETSPKYGVVEIKIVDKFGKSISGATAQALQWDSNTSSYKRVSEGITAEDGKSILNIVLDDKQYIFRGEFAGLSKNTTPQFIPELLNGKLIIISLDTGPTDFESFLDYVTYTINETFINNVSDITFEWSTDGTDIQGFINYYRLQSTGEKTLISTDTDTGSDVILFTSKLINSSYFVIAEVGFVVDGLEYVQKTYEYQPSNSIAEMLEDTGLSIFLMPLLYLVVVLIGMANVFIGGILLIIVSGVGLTLFPQYLTTELMAFFYFLGIAVMIGGAKRR